MQRGKGVRAGWEDPERFLPVVVSSGIKEVGTSEHKSPVSAVLAA